MGREDRIEEMERTEILKAPFLFSSRFALALAAFFGFVVLYIQRFNMSVAIVCMVNNTAVRAEAGIDADGGLEGETGDRCPATVRQSSGTTHDETGEFVWGKPIQGIVLSAFFWGYLLTQLPGGWLATYLGGKRVYGYGQMLASVMALLAPVASRYSYKALLVVRFIQGIGQGVVFPAMHAFWGTWAHPYERSKLVNFTIAGSQIGNIIVFPLSARLCDKIGWYSIFYICGSFGILWFIGWMFVVYDSPAVHPRITEREREYIESAIKGNVREEDMPIPWRHLLTSLPVWAIVAAHFSMGWGFYTLATNLPTFLKEILRFDITSNGLYSALPWLSCAIMIFVSGWIADELRERHIMTTLAVRRACMIIGLAPPILLVGSGYLGCNHKQIFIVLLVVGQGLFGFSYTAVFPNMVDIAPAYGGIIFGISNTVTTIAGILTPYLISIVTKNQTKQEWQIVFWISLCVGLLGVITFMLLASGDVQWWAKTPEETRPVLSDSAARIVDVKESGRANETQSPPIVQYETGL